MTSFILISKLLPLSKKNGFTFFLFLLLIFDLYRAHLALHVLKDTLIIFSLVLFLNSSNIIKFLGFGLGLFLRFAFPIYILTTQKINIRFVLVFMGLFLIAYNFVDNFYFLITGAQEDIVFREFDKMPTFNQYGVWGDILRVITWPFLLISVIFFLISPSIYFIPIFFALLSYNLYYIFCLKKFPYTISFFVSIGIIAFLVPGFTSFIRYAYPLIVVLPLIHLKNFKQK